MQPLPPTVAAPPRQLRLQPAPPTVAARASYSCSPAPPTVAARATHGCSPRQLRLQVAEQQRQRDVADERQRLGAQLAQERWEMWGDLGRCGEI